MKFYKPKITVDTSAIIKWFKIEEDRERALKLRNWAEAAKTQLVISAILLSECARGLKKAGWEDTEIYESLHMLDMIVSFCGMELIPVDRLVVKSAQTFVIEHSIYSADAIHVATAVLTGSDFFVSSDEHHIKQGLKEEMKKKGVKVLRLSEIDEVAEKFQ